MDGVLGRSHANAAPSIEVHQPDSLNQHGAVLGEQASLNVADAPTFSTSGYPQPATQEAGTEDAPALNREASQMHSLQRAESPLLALSPMGLS
jgi:hypothetical protein